MLSRLNPRIKRLWRPICDGGNCVCSTEFMVLRSESEENKSLLYSILDSELFYEFMLTNVTGATNSHQRVSPPGIVLEYKLALPNHVLRNRFVKIVDTFHYKIDQNIKQNQTLAQIRDTLLPKLMSGEIRIPLD